MSTVVVEELFEAGASQVPVGPAERPAGEEKCFRRYDPDQVLLMAPSIQEWVPEGHLARFVSDLVDETLDLSAIYASYEQERGYPPYDPRLMVKLLIYGYATGTPSSRKLEERTHSDVAVRFLCADQHPDYRSIARFRRRHLEALSALFVQALRLCKQAGLVKLGALALDGTKLREEVGAPWAGFHTFRHTCASMLFERGANAKQVQRWLGHHSPSFTLDTYVHLLVDDLGEPLTVVQEEAVPERTR